MRISRRILPPFALALITLLASSGPGQACNVPVFRYALDRWAPSTYTFVVFHDRELTDAQKKALAVADPSLNAKVELIDTATGVPKSLQALWAKKPANAALPWVAVRLPDADQADAPIWSGPLTGEGLKPVCDSSARRALIKALAAGDAAVYILLESGDAGADRAAVELLAKELPALEKTVALPKPKADDPPVRLPVPAKPKFTVLKLSRTAPGEAALVAMLLGCDDKLAKLKGPVVLPVFGRGRVLCAFHGDTLDAKNLKAAAEFVCAPCSCRVKELNPGVDLLLAADWKALLENPPKSAP